jgi:hypothetical protein
MIDATSPFANVLNGSLFSEIGKDRAPKNTTGAFHDIINGLDQTQSPAPASFDRLNHEQAAMILDGHILRDMITPRLPAPPVAEPPEEAAQTTPPPPVAETPADAGREAAISVPEATQEHSAHQPAQQPLAPLPGVIPFMNSAQAIFAAMTDQA